MNIIHFKKIIPLITATFFLAILFSVPYVAALTTLGVSSSKNGPTNGLVGWWTFDGKNLSSSTSTDSSGQGNNGTLVNGPTPTSGKSGQALSFDGVSKAVNIADTAALRPGTGPFTYAAWIKPPNQNQTFGTFVSKRLASGSFNQVAVAVGGLDSSCNQIASKQIGFAIVQTGGSDLYCGNTTSNVVDGGWHHVALVRLSNNTIQVYVDGVSVPLSVNLNIGTGAGGNINNTSSVRIGDGNGSLPYLGVVDDVRIYNRALSAQEIASLVGIKATTKAVSNGSLVGWWSFDPGYINGSVAKDQSGYGNHATLTNSPTVTTGKVGKAINLIRSSSQYLVAPASASLNSVSGQNTFSAWLYPTTNTTWTAVFSQRSSCGSNFGIQVYTYDAIACPANNESAYQLTNNSGTSYTLCAPRLPLNQWTHFVGTYDGSSMKVYQNGTLATSSTIGSITLRTSSVPTYIGYDSCNNNHFDGKMDDVRLYSRALSPNEVTNLYNSKVATTAYSTYSSSTIPVSNGLIMYQPFDGKYLNSSTSTDITGQGNDGTRKNTLKGVPGILGQGLLFGGSGSGYISLGDKLDMGTSSMTLNIWFKSTQLGDGGLYGVMGKSLYGNQDGRYSVAITGNEIWAFVEAPEIRAQTSVLPYNDGKFHMLTATFDRTSNITVYVDGVSKVTADITALSGSNMQTSDLFLIGKYNDNTGSDSNAMGAFLFPGTLDDARVYNRVLTQQEIKTLYKLGGR